VLRSRQRTKRRHSPAIASRAGASYEARLATLLIRCSKSGRRRAVDLRGRATCGSKSACRPALIGADRLGLTEHPDTRHLRVGSFAPVPALGAPRWGGGSGAFLTVG